MRKSLYYFSMMILGMAFFVIAQFMYMLYWPHNFAEVKSSWSITPQVKPAGQYIYAVDYCKFMKGEDS